MPASASRSATLVWVYAPALTMAAAAPLLAGAVDAADQLALAVALETFDADAEGCAERGDVPLDVGQRGMPVNLRLARAEQIEIWAVEQQDVFHGWLSL